MYRTQEDFNAAAQAAMRRHAELSAQRAKDDRDDMCVRLLDGAIRLVVERNPAAFGGDFAVTKAAAAAYAAGRRG